MVWWLTALWVCAASVHTAHAQDHITERAWLEDPSGQLTWAQAQQLPAQAFEGVLNRGYGTGVLWLRLRIEPQRRSVASSFPSAASADAPRLGVQDLVLRVRPAYLDEITLFDPLLAGEAGDGVAGVAGDRYHPRLDALQGADFLLPIALGSAPRDVWLRLSTTSTRQIYVSALLPHDLSAQTARESLVASLYVGVVLVLLLWGLAASVLQQAGVMRAFALMQFTSLLFGLSTLGILRVFWPLAWSAELLDLLGSVFSIVVVTTGIWFHVRFLRGFRPAAWAMGLLYAMPVWSLVNLALLWAGQVGWALQGNMASILLSPFVCLACALTGRAWATASPATRPAPGKRVLVAFYLLFLFIFLLASTTGLGLAQATEWTMYVSQLHGLVTSVLLMLILQYRAHVLNRQQQHLAMMLETARLQAQHEFQMRKEQEDLLVMLAHEIKTPLATMHLRLDGQARGAREVRQAIRDMNGVIERCLQTLQVGDRKLAPQWQKLDLAGVVRDAVSACAQPERVRLNLPVSPLPSLSLVSDPQFLFMVLGNMLDNACKYSEPDTVIDLRCQRAHVTASQAVIRLELSNVPGSAGLPDATQLFQKYYRSPAAQRRSGTGLGLYLAQNLARMLGGQIAYEPQENLAKFVLTLPIGADL